MGLGVVNARHLYNPSSINYFVNFSVYPLKISNTTVCHLNCQNETEASVFIAKNSIMAR